MENPLKNLVNFNVPYDRATVAKWVRYHVRTNATVRAILALDVDFSLPRFVFLCDPAHEPWRSLAAAMNALLVDFALAHVEMGEAFATFDPDRLDHAIVDPEQVRLRWRSAVEPAEPSLVISPSTWRLISAVGNAELMAHLRERGRETEDGIEMPLPNAVWVVDRHAPYDERGTSRMVPVLKILAYLEALTEAEVKAISADVEAPGRPSRPSIAEDRDRSIQEIAAHLLHGGAGRTTFDAIRLHWVERHRRYMKIFRERVVEPFAKERGTVPPDLIWTRMYDRLLMKVDQVDLLRQLHAKAGLSKEMLLRMFGLESRWFG